VAVAEKELSGVKVFHGQEHSTCFFLLP